MQALFPVAIILHVIGASVMLAAAGIEVHVAWRLRAAGTAAEVITLTRSGEFLGKMYMTAVITQLVTGIFMGLIIGPFTPWLVVCFLTFVALAIIGPLTNMPTFRGFAKTAQEAGEITPDLRARLNAGGYISRIQTMNLMVVAIFILMVGGGGGHITGWPAPISIIILAIIVGYVSSLLMLRKPAPVSEQPQAPGTPA